VILTLISVLGTGLAYFLGVSNPGRQGRGTGKGWLAALVIGLCLAGVFYLFSAMGLMVSLDNLLDGL
jgi:hypothetical protein